MYKKLLVAADGSDGSKAALEEAAKIARISNSEVVLMNVILSPEAYRGYYPHSKANKAELVEIGQKVLDDTAEGMALADIKLNKKVHVGGSPVLEILDEAGQTDPDLIVLGSNGLGAFGHTLLGSVSLKVLKTSIHPVLIVKDHKSIEKLSASYDKAYYTHTKKTYDKILVGTDGSQASREAFCEALKIAQKNQCKIVLLSVVPRPPEYLGIIDEEKFTTAGQEILDKTLKGFDLQGIELTQKVKSGSPAMQIVSEANELEADMIVLGSNGIGLFVGTILGSVSEMVLKTALCPVLIVKDTDTKDKLRANSIEGYYEKLKKQQEDH